MMTLSFHFKDGWHSNNVAFDLRSEPAVWRLILRSETTHQETLASSDQTEVVTYYDSVKPTSNGLNTAEIRLFKGPRPLSSRMEEHVWLALFSENLFANKKPPLNDMGLCMNEPDVFTQFTMEAGDVSPRIAVWHNVRADKYSGQTLIKGQFVWLQETNIGSKYKIPIKSRLEMSIASTNGQMMPVSITELTINSINENDAGEVSIQPIKGRAPVYDYRLDDEIGNSFAYIQYDTHDGIIPTVGSLTVLDARSRTPAFKAADAKMAESYKKYVIWGLFLLITLAFVFFFVSTARKE